MSDPVTRLNAALEGRYRIERELGEGGMATVYLAADIKHERNVALKVLKPELAAVVGAERFLAEIKTTANLQHPNILPLFDSGEADSQVFYVMPYVEGESLRDRLDREHQLPVAEAVRITTDVAEALQAAHERGIVHRDIKPANVLLSSGRPLVADFGIALAVSAAGGPRLTETGLSVGTPYYMSPEQATGDQTTGPPCDIYALGCVLYETLVGDPPYMGSTAQAVLGKILMGEVVSARKTRSTVPANVDAAIRKALEKLPADRFANAGEFARALADPSFRHGDVAGATVPTTGTRWRGVSIALAATATGLTGALAWTLFGPAPANPVERFEVPYDLGVESPPSLLPDGSGIVVARTNQGAQGQLWLRHWNDLTLRPIPGTEVRSLRRELAVTDISPDGREVVFIVADELKVATLEGGGVRTLADSVLCCPRWDRGGFLYFSGLRRGIDRVPASGGSVEPVTTLQGGDGSHSDFNLLEGGEVGVFSVWASGSASSSSARIEAIHLPTGERTVVAPGMRPYVTPEGHLIFASQAGEILGAPFDADTRELIDAPVTLVDGVLVNRVPYPVYDVSASGTLVYQVAEASTAVQPVWMTRTGDVSPVDPEWTADRGEDDRHAFRISPDGTRIAFSHVLDGNQDIWIKVLPDGPVSRLTFDRANDQTPRWGPGSESVTFVSSRGGGVDLWSKRSDGVGGAELVLDLERDIVLGAWGPEGEWLVIRLVGRTGFLGERDIWAWRSSDDTEPLPLVATEFVEQAPAISPDGRWIAYSSNETGRPEVFVQPFPEVAGGRWQVSTGGGIRPLWAHSGREIFFVNEAARELIAAEVRTDAGFEIGERRPLFTIPVGYRIPQNGDFYDVTADGQRFLMARPAQSAEAERPTLILVQNWFTELRERMNGN